MRMLSLLALVAAAPVLAQDQTEFCTDRPGLATGICTAAPGTFQLESSFVEWAFSRDSQSRVDEVAVAASNLRYGLDDRTDFQISWTPHVSLRERSPEGVSRHHGTGDLQLAVKRRLTANDRPVAVALMPFLKVPLARRQIGNRRFEGGVLLPIEFSLSAPLSLTLTPEVDWNANEDGRGHHAALALAASLGASLGERWSAALDGLVSREREGSETTKEALAGISLAFLATPTLQFDFEADIGLSRAAPDVQLLSGFAMRF